MLNKKRGVTLIGLVVTIVVLLILVIITIAVVIGPNGVIKKAQETSIEKRIGELKDKAAAWQADTLVRNQRSESSESLIDFFDRLQTEGIITVDERETADEIEGTIIINGKLISLLNPYAPPMILMDSSLVNIGDIVYYDPTAGVSNPATNPLLQYTSPKGSTKADGAGSNEPGNGQQNQTFQATSNDCKWVVLYKKDGQLVLMSYDLKVPSVNAYNGKFGMLGAAGYLYVEQELHKICSIYGHGKGAAIDAKYSTTPKIGLPDIPGDLTDANVPSQSGARSLMLEDIEYVTGINTYEKRKGAAEFYFVQSGSWTWYNDNFKDYYMNEGKPIPTSNIKMPTLTQSVVNNKPLFTYYIIDKADPNVPESLREHIFKPELDDEWYLLASRCVLVRTSNLAEFRVCSVSSSGSRSVQQFYGKVFQVVSLDILQLILCVL